MEQKSENETEFQAYLLANVRTVLMRLTENTSAFVYFTLLPLVVWNVFALLGSNITWLIFISGPFLGMGLLISTIAGVEGEIGYHFFISIANSLVVLTIVALLETLLLGGTYQQEMLMGFFDLLYISLLIIVWEYSGLPNITTDVSDLGMSEIKHFFLFIFTLVTVFTSSYVMGSTGQGIFNILSYALLSVIILFGILSQREDGSDIYLILSVGIGMLWLRAFSTQGLLVGDGSFSIRLARIMINNGISGTLSQSRTSNMYSVKHLLPSLSLLVNWPVTQIAKYVIPSIVGTSLLGVFYLTLEWLPRRGALAAALLLGTKSMFFSATILNYRTAFAFFVLVALWASVVRSGKRNPLVFIYVFATIAFHDTVGIFLLFVLILYSALSLIVSIIITNEAANYISALNIAIIGGGIYYVIFLGSKSFDRVAVLISYSISEYLAGNSLSTRQGASSQVNNFTDSLAGILLTSSIFAEILLMAIGTAILLICWLYRRSASTLLRKYSADINTEILIVANACVFAVLVMIPRLGVHRAYLYASPLLVGLLPLFIYQLPSLNSYVGFKRLVSFSSSSILPMLMVLIILFGLVNHIGILYLFADGDGTAGPQIGVTGVENYYTTVNDKAARNWMGDYVTADVDIYADYYGWNFLRSDPSIASRHYIPANGSVRNLSGCTFIRDGNSREKKFYINNPGETIGNFETDLLERSSEIYTTNDSSIICN